MRTVILLLLSLLLGGGVGCAGAASAWQSLIFDGRSFVNGSGSGALLTRDGYLPVPAGGATAREDQLPAGTGAVAIFCYQQRSGGKLKSHYAMLPLRGAAVTITGTGLTLAARSDESGYLIIALPAGVYQLHFAGFSKSVTVEKGKASLVAFRGSKRMVD